MSNNTVYVQGNYVDIHDNEVVNLNIDKANVTVSATPKGGALPEETKVAPADEKNLQCDEEALKERAAVLTGNAAFMKILAKAVEQGLCAPQGWQYKWLRKGEAAYFASVASQAFALSDRRDHDGDLAISWIPFEALFGEKRLRLSYNDYKQCKTNPKRKTEIDRLFK